jgi:A118 family predicted phage portal protein
MFQKLIKKIKEALQKMIAYRDVTEVVSEYDDSISNKMQDAISRWNSIYQDNSPWLTNKVHSLQLGKSICQTMAMMVLSEMESQIDGKTERAKTLNEQYQEHLVEKLADNVEFGMALGSLIMKPYISGNEIYIDFCKQGDYLPIAYDDDGNITDVAFQDSFTVGKTTYTRIERQTFTGNSVIIEEKAFKSNNDDLGTEIPLTSVPRWASHSEEPVVIEDVKKPLFGVYKVPLANNIDYNSPLGISIFAPAEKLIQKADEQFSRLDWEYQGGELAIDVAESALIHSTSYFGKDEVDFARMGEHAERLYRGLDTVNEDTYHVFNPTLRDANYQSGLEKYLMRIEDNIGLARGSLSEVSSEARTATEIRILKQRTYITVKAHQKALEKALIDCVDAMNVLATLYDENENHEEVQLIIEWKDSVLTDTNEELNQKLQLVDAGILSKAELRSWWNGETLEIAQEKIDEIGNGLEDIFTGAIDMNIGDE